MMSWVSVYRSVCTVGVFYYLLLREALKLLNSSFLDHKSMQFINNDTTYYEITFANTIE